MLAALLSRTWAVVLLTLLSPGLCAATDAGSRHILKRDGRELEVRISEQFEPAMHKNLLNWIDFLSENLAQVFGHWPRNRWQVSIEPASAAGEDPIPWAQVHRGKPDRVEFFTTRWATQAQLKHAWTGYHEFAHLLIPYRGWGDAWFSEGLASYYQNLLRARAGVLSARQVWQKLYEGYQRGVADSRFDGQTLESVSDNLRRNGAFMRVYWSGAWYFLVADTRLRQRSGGRQTLDQALQRLNGCCADQSLSVPQIVAKLDELNDVDLFRPLYQQAIATTRIPSYIPPFRDLGITVANDRLNFTQDGEAARLRRQIISDDSL